MKGFELIAAGLADEGVKTFFGLPGDGNMYVDDELVERYGAKYVKAVREDGAIAMAHAFGVVSGQPAVASVTLGPGLTNALTALTSVTRAHAPLLLVTGGSTGPTHLQSIDQRQLAEVAGAGYVRVSHEECGSAVAVAMEMARSESRAVVLEVPLDFQQGVVSAPNGTEVRHQVKDDSVSLNEDSIDEAVGILASCRRPVVIAGAGAVRANLREDLLHLASVLGAPLATTLLAKDYFRGEPTNLGICGTFSSASTTDIIAASDCLIVFGASLNAFTTAEGSLAKGKAIVHCDTNPGIPGAITPVRCSVIGDMSIVAGRLCDHLGELGHEPSEFGRQSADQIAARAPWDEFTEQKGPRVVDMRSFLIRLEELLPPDRSISVDGGHFLAAPIRYLHLENPSHFVWTLSFGSIGFGLAAGIGAACGRPNAPAVAVVGDGGFMMSAAELSTAVRYNLDLIVVVLNDGSYGAEYHSLRLAGRSPALSLFDWPDLADLARAFHCSSVCVRNMGSDIDLVAQAIDKRSGPLVIDVHLDPAVTIGFHD